MLSPSLPALVLVHSTFRLSLLALASLSAASIVCPLGFFFYDKKRKVGKKKVEMGIYCFGRRIPVYPVTVNITAEG